MKRIDRALQKLFEGAVHGQYHEAAREYAEAENTEPAEQQPEEVVDAPVEESTAKVIQLPFWPEPVRAAPSDLLRSALFGIRKKGAREFLRGDEVLASWAGCELRFHGQRLDQFDQDVWLQTLHLHRQQSLPSVVYSTNRAFLKELGLSGGGRNIERLHRSLTRLQGSVVKFDTPDYLFNRNLIAKWDLEKGTERIAVELEPDVVRLFDGNVAKLDWSTRLALKTDLAKWLHGYIQTHRATKQHPHRVPVEQLRQLCGSQSPLKRFRFNIKAACEQLVAQGTLDSWRITPNDALEVVRPSRPNLKLEA